jgi:spore maturation protein CgeB
MNIPTPYSQIKGRVFESMACGAMVLEDNGDITRRFFEPDVDFAMFDCGWQKTGQLRFDDILIKVRYYLANNEERTQIAQSGWKKVNEQYNARTMWENIFGYLGL